jgi:hypothetical protein
MAGLAGYALSVGGFAAAFTAFAMAALVLVALVFASAFAVAGAQEATLERFKAQAAGVKRWGGRVLVLLGGWFVALALFADFFADLFPV